MITSWSELPGLGKTSHWENVGSWESVFGNASAQIEYKVQLAAVRSDWSFFGAPEEAIIKEAQRRTMEKFK